MRIKQIYLGTWFQRTSLHLKELYRFLKFQKGQPGLGEDRLQHLWNNLNVKKVEFIGNNEFDEIVVLCGHIIVSVTEDGIILLTTKETDIKKAKNNLESFYTEFFAPMLSYLFSLGAPLPMILNQAKDVHPFLVATQNLKDKEADQLYSTFHDEKLTTLTGNHLSVYIGDVLSIFNVKNPRKFSYIRARELLHYVIFFREFEKQLDSYLALHRTMWDRVTAIREAEQMAYKDFPRIREEILTNLKTLSFVKARLAQMRDIIEERQHTIEDKIKNELHALGLLRFDHLEANQKYVSHLWQMTIEYVKSSLSLLESLYQENTQKELNAIKFITFGALITGFFGMNIAFPWEDRWEDIKISSFLVVFIFISLLISFYYILKVTIYNRNFLVRKKLQD